MFIGVLWLRRKRTNPSNTVGVDVLGDPKATNLILFMATLKSSPQKDFTNFIIANPFVAGRRGRRPLQCLFVAFSHLLTPRQIKI